MDPISVTVVLYPYVVSIDYTERIVADVAFVGGTLGPQGPQGEPGPPGAVVTITSGTALPAGGNDGDVYFQYA